MKTTRQKQEEALARRKKELLYWKDSDSPQVRRLLHDFTIIGAKLHIQKIATAERDIANLEKKLVTTRYI